MARKPMASDASNPLHHQPLGSQGRKGVEARRVRRFHNRKSGFITDQKACGNTESPRRSSRVILLPRPPAGTRPRPHATHQQSRPEFIGSLNLNLADGTNQSIGNKYMITTS